MKKLLLLPLIAISCKTTSNGCSYTLNINKDCDSIMVLKYGEIYMPKIPVDGAKSINFYGIESGTYLAQIFDNGRVENIKFKVK